MFVKEDHISQLRSVGAGDHVLEDESTAVETNGGREEQADLLRECAKACRRITRGGDEGAGVNEAGGEGVFIVDVEKVGILILLIVRL